MADSNETYYISKVNLPGDNKTYHIKDQWARDKIETIGKYKHYLGVTTTNLVDNVTTNPVVSIGGTDVTADVGSIVSIRQSGKPDKEFVYAPKVNQSATDPGIWQEFGSSGNLGQFAYVDKGTVTIKPNGTVSKPTFSGTQGSVSVSGTTSASNIAVEVSDTATPTGNAGYQPSGSVTSSYTTTDSSTSITSTGEFTPSGSVDYGSTASSKTLESTGTFAPTGSISSTFTGTQGSVSVSASSKTFEVTGTTTVPSGKIGYTPEGSVAYGSDASTTTLTSTGTFTPYGTFSGSLTGTQGSVSVKNSSEYTVDVTGTTTVPSGKTAYRPTGTVSKPVVTVTPTTSSFCKNASVDTLTETLIITFDNAMTDVSASLASAPTFTGTNVYLSGSIAANGLTSTGNFTPQGTISGNITGTAGSVTVSGTLPTATFSGTKTYLTGSTGTITSTGNFTPSGSVSSTFTGNEDDVSVTGTLPVLTYTPTQGTISVSGKLKTISSNFSGDKKYLYVSAFAGGSISATGNFTPHGTVSQPTFDGTSETHDVDPKTST